MTGTHRAADKGQLFEFEFACPGANCSKNGGQCIGSAAPKCPTIPTYLSGNRTIQIIDPSPQ
jgi:hypothetical protein